MFSFAGDTVFDPFTGTATTQVAARQCGRSSIGAEVDFAEGPRIVADPDMSAFFDRLASCVRERNPDRFRDGPT